MTAQETIDALRERLKLANWALCEIKARRVEFVMTDAEWSKMHAALGQAKEPI